MKIYLALDDLDLQEESDGCYYYTKDIKRESRGVIYTSNIEVHSDGQIFLRQEHTVQWVGEEKKVVVSIILLMHQPQTIPEVADLIEAILGIDVRKRNKTVLQDLIRIDL